jgi:MFS family permease
MTGLTVFASAYLIAAICLALAGLIVVIWPRPDPLLLLERDAHVSIGASPGKQQGRIRQVVGELRGNRLARVAMIALLTAQVVMAGIMTITPVHIAHQGGSITIIGITISLHVAGMYALAPLVGLIADRFGYRITISGGIAIFLASLVIGAARADDTGWIVVSLILLGVGWSFVNVAGSALFSAVVPPAARAASQGGVDALSNLGGATAALVAGPLLFISSFSFLSILAIVALIPLTLLMATRSLTPHPAPLLGPVARSSG